MILLCHEEVSIPLDELRLRGTLFIPLNAKAIIIFSHGRGNSTYNKRNQQVAEYLHEKDFGTLLIDLLTEKEYKNSHSRSSYIELLGSRLIEVTRWLEKFHVTTDLPIGYFVAGPDTASSLYASATLPEIEAIVSWGGRPDLPPEFDLQRVNTPTLFIVGSLDEDTLELNKEAYSNLNCEKKLAIIEGACDWFKALGKMEIVLKLTSGWFEKYLNVVKV